MSFGEVNIRVNDVNYTDPLKNPQARTLEGKHTRVMARLTQQAIEDPATEETRKQSGIFIRPSPALKGA